MTKREVAKLLKLLANELATGPKHWGHVLYEDIFDDIAHLPTIDWDQDVKSMVDAAHRAWKNL